MRNVGFALDTKRLASPAGHLFPCVHVRQCVSGEGSSECVNPFFLVDVAGPPSCFSPHIITILLLLHPLVTWPCTPVQSLGPSSKGFTVLWPIRTHTYIYTHIHAHIPHVHCHTQYTLPIFLPALTFRGQQRFTQLDKQQLILVVQTMLPRCVLSLSPLF